MADVNPYEPPREPESLTRGRVVKRSLGAGTIILLTPAAMVIAILGTCTGTKLVRVYSVALMLGVPLAILVVMMVAASIVELWQRRLQNRRAVNIGVLLAIPLAVAAACAIGVPVAYVTLFLVGYVILAGVGPNVASQVSIAAAMLTFWSLRRQR